MTPRATIREVAAAAGVSLGTASRALSGRGAVAPTTQQRVREAAERLDYRANGAARALRAGRSATIGLLIPDVRNPYFSHLAHEVEQRALAHGVITLLCNGDERPEQMAMYVDVLRERRVDGVITAPFQNAADALQTLHADQIPVVFIDRLVPDCPIPSVTSDTAPAIAEAIALFAAHGHRRIGCITGPLATSTGTERRDQVAAAAAENGLEVLWEQGDYQPGSGERGARNLHAAGVHAILACDARMSIGAIRALQDLQVRIGQDLHLIGFDDLPDLALARPAMTIVRQDIAAMAATAVDMLRRLRAGEHVESVRIPTTLLIRESTPQPEERRHP